MDIKYTEISKAKIAKSRNAVISKCSKGGFTLAQQIEVTEGESKTVVFLKGALHIDDVEGLIDLRNAINAAINADNEEIETGYEWD